MILQTRGKNLRGASTVLINEDCHRHIRELTINGASVAMQHGLSASARFNDCLACWQQQLAYSHGGVERSARIVAQVEHDPADAIGPELCHYVGKLRSSAIAER